MHQLGYPMRNIWGMYPVTMVLEAQHPDTMEASAAEFGQAQQGQMLGQQEEPDQEPEQQMIPVGQTTNWELEYRPEYMKAPLIEWGGIRMGAQVPIVVTPFDELERRYGVYEGSPFMGQVPIRIPSTQELNKPYDIMESNPWAGINLRPLGSPVFMGQVPLRMGQFEAAPVEDGYAMVDPLALAYTSGAYIRPGAPEWGRFPVMPPGVTYRV